MAKKLKEQIKELTEILQRTQANFENYRKQTEKRIQEIHDMANKDLTIQLLTVLDNFELALKLLNSENSKGLENSKNFQSNAKNPEEFVEGVKLIYSQLTTVLENNGLKPIKTKNQIFDPHAHEALIKVDSDKPENAIVEELQKGFLLNDKVIRHAKVKVSAGKRNDQKK